MSARLNKRRALALLEQAQLHASRNEWDKVADAARQVAYDSELDESGGFALLAHAQRQLGRRDEARRTLEDGLERFDKDADLEAGLGGLLLEIEDTAGALEHLERARAKKKRDPAILTHYAAALLRAGRLEEAESQLAIALLAGGGLDAKLVLALVKGRRARFEEADALAAAVEAQAKDPSLQWAARAVRADARLMLGDAAGAIERWKAIEAAGMLDPQQLGHMAWAAQLLGDTALADTLIARRTAQGPTTEDLLLFAQIANHRHEPEHALALLDQAQQAKGEREPGWEFFSRATRGRALRLAGRSAEAHEVLEAAAKLPDASVKRVGGAVFVDLGHLAAEAGEFERAHEHFTRALELDPGEPEAQRALELTKRKVAWRASVESSAEERVESARAEVDALRRRFLSRESEVEALRRELARLKASQEAELERVQAEVDAERERIKLEQQRRLREELEARERDADEKAKENLERAFGGAAAACPRELWQMILVAERTYQKALYTELPAAAVAVLFSGALERSLLELLVRPFDAWLEAQGRRDAFLTGATREKRGKRVEYFDKFVEAFDRELNGRAPGLGEISRVLDRRNESYLGTFRDFLAASFSVDDAFFGELGVFVQWSKEKLRDPVAHGRLELAWDELKQFREQLLFRFAAAEPGALPRLLSARTSP